MADFKEIKSRFPTTVWDGSSLTRQGSNIDQRDSPDGFDCAQMVAEIIAAQQAINGLGDGGSGVPEDFTGLAYFYEGVPYVLNIHSSLVTEETLGFNLETGPYFESAQIALAQTQDLQNVTVNTLLEITGDLKLPTATPPEDTVTVDAWAKIMIGTTEYRIPLYEAGNPS